MPCPLPLDLPFLRFRKSPWRTLEGVIAQQMNSATFYTFRLGEKLIFIGGDPNGGESIGRAVGEALER